MKFTVILSAVVLSFSLLSCGEGSKMNQSTIESALFKEHGVIGGVSIGDNWSEIKESSSEFWTINDENGLTQLRKDWGDVNNSIILSVNLIDNKTVNQIDFSLIGTKENYVVIKKIHKKLVAYYNSKYEQTEKEEWIVQEGDQQNSVSVVLNENENNLHLQSIVFP